MATQCPNKTLLIEELDGEEEVEEVVYEPNTEDIVEIGEDDSTQLASLEPYHLLITSMKVVLILM